MSRALVLVTALTAALCVSSISDAAPADVVHKLRSTGPLASAPWRSIICMKAQRGQVRYSLLDASLEYCDGKYWRPVASPGSYGYTGTERTCLDILKRGKASGDGFYFLSLPNGTRYRAFCDMSLEGGGWTLFATKASPSFPFLKATFDPSSAVATDYDASGCVPQSDWSQVLFRFRHDGGSSRVVYTRHQGTATAARTLFEATLSCEPQASNIDAIMDGFHSHSPYRDGGQRNPSINFHAINELHYDALKSSLSQTHSGSGEWISLWHNVGGDNYDFVDNSTAAGRKCLAGSCFLNQPVWVMYR